MKFRPCIDLHKGRVKQIVGGSLRDDDPGALVTNFETARAPSEFAALYRRDGLAGGHVIMLGPGNEAAAIDALAAFPGGLQAGGGITPGAAHRFLDAGASHVIVTSYVFREGRVDETRLGEMVAAVGRDRLVLDLSCKLVNDSYVIVTDRWQKSTATAISARTLASLAAHCSEFLVHAAHVEGRRRGIDAGLVELLAEHSPIPVTYAGGVRSLNDLDRIDSLGNGRVDATVGSALDIFGGPLPYHDVVAWHRRRQE